MAIAETASRNVAFKVARMRESILQNSLVVDHHGNVLKIRITCYKLILLLHYYSVPQPSYFESHVSINIRHSS